MTEVTAVISVLLTHWWMLFVLQYCSSTNCSIKSWWWQWLRVHVICHQSGQGVLLWLLRRRSSDYWLMLICIHHKTYGSENKKKLEHIVYKKSPKVALVYYTANAMMRNKIYTLSILIVPNSFIKNLQYCTGRHRPTAVCPLCPCRPYRRGWHQQRVREHLIWRKPPL